MASNQTFSDWYFEFCKERNRTPGQEEIWNAALASRTPSPAASSTDAEGAQQIADAVQAGWNACVRNVFSLTDQTGDETADKSSDFERGRRFEAKGIARAMNGFGPEHCDDLHRFFTTPAPSQQREKAHEGPLVGDQIPADQHAAQSERQSWWTDSIVGDGLEGCPPPPPSASQFLQRADARWEENGRLLGRAFSAFGDGYFCTPDVLERILATPTAAAPAVTAPSEAVALTDEQLATIAYKGYDDYWTEHCPGKEPEAWAASAKAVIAALQTTKPQDGSNQGSGEPDDTPLETGEGDAR